MKHALRIEAEKKYAAAANALRSYNGTDESEFVAIDEAYRNATAELVAVEAQYPLPKELARRSNLLRLRNRGLDA